MKRVEDRYYSFLFFIFAALILVFTVVTVQQIRMAQFNKRMCSVEDSVTRIEDGVDELIDAVKKYGWEHEEARDFSQQTDRGTEVGTGDRREGR